MPNEATIRPYKAGERECILRLLRLNTPKYFSPQEEDDLAHYLDNGIEGYFVVELDGAIVGSGGINFTNDGRTGIISWDIFHPQYQGRSLGTQLLAYRLAKLKEHGVAEIIVRTSQLAYQFYEKSGFHLVEVEEDHWAQGYHLYKMKYAGSSLNAR